MLERRRSSSAALFFARRSVEQQRPMLSLIGFFGVLRCSLALGGLWADRESSLLRPQDNADRVKVGRQRPDLVLMRLRECSRI